MAKILVEYNISDDTYSIWFGHMDIRMPWQLMVQLQRRLNDIKFPYSHDLEEQAHRAETDLDG